MNNLEIFESDESYDKLCTIIISRSVNKMSSIKFVKNNFFHRTSGPAIEHFDEISVNKFWYTDGVFIKKAYETIIKEADLNR